MNKNISDGGTHTQKKVYPVDVVTRVPPVGGIEMISSRDENAELVKVFLHRDEKDEVKAIASMKGVPVSHLARALLLAWVEENRGDKSA